MHTPSVSCISWPWHSSRSQKQIPLAPNAASIRQLQWFCSVCSQTSFWLWWCYLQGYSLLTWLSAPVSGSIFVLKGRGSELLYFRSSHSFSSAVWTTTSDQPFEIIDFKSLSAPCACYVTTRTNTWVLQSAGSLNQTLVLVSLSPFCIG